jgi:organic hydroperoxide reductase OsmC/OhrA
MEPTQSSFSPRVTPLATSAPCGWSQARQGTPVGPDTKVAAGIGFGKNTRGEGFNLDVTLRVSDHGLDRAVIDDLIQKAHQVCPYSNATRGNVDVDLSAE